MSTLLAIDPGPVYSAYCIIDIVDYKPKKFDILDNYILSKKIIDDISRRYFVIEMINSYGMAVGKETFETCVWIGRFIQIVENKKYKNNDRLGRKDVKLNLCNSVKANDSNIIQALIDRFAPYVQNKGKGIKSNKGWFYGFKADIWQAYALGVTYIDLNLKGK